MIELFVLFTADLFESPFVEALERYSPTTIIEFGRWLLESVLRRIFYRQFRSRAVDWNCFIDLLKVRVE